MKVLPESAQVPPGNLIDPAPSHFTHQVVAAQPYYYGEPRKGSPPDGDIPAGTNVVLMQHDGGPYCRVVDGKGLYVVTAHAGLRKLV